MADSMRAIAAAVIGLTLVALVAGCASLPLLDGRCPQWLEHTSSGEVVCDVEPGTSAGQRSWIQFLEVLPIEWLL